MISTLEAAVKNFGTSAKRAEVGRLPGPASRAAFSGT
jgi:hypothetical protein